MSCEVSGLFLATPDTTVNYYQLLTSIAFIHSLDLALCSITTTVSMLWALSGVVDSRVVL